MQNLKVLVVDDEIQIRRLLKVGLESSNLKILEAENGEDGIQAVVNHKPDLVILDLGLPGITGLEVLKQIRSWSQVPIIILSVQDDEGAKVEALDAGADDYLCKPFSMAELQARMRASLRKKIVSEAVSVYENGSLKVDLSARTVLKNQTEVHLTATEYHLLSFFIRHSGKVVTHQQILHEVWRGQSVENHTQYLRIFVGTLRKKIELDPSHPVLIITEPGVGYRLRESS